jgi:hypothetical protein
MSLKGNRSRAIEKDYRGIRDGEDGVGVVSVQ